MNNAPTAEKILFVLSCIVCPLFFFAILFCEFCWYLDKKDKKKAEMRKLILKHG